MKRIILVLAILMLGGCKILDIGLGPRVEQFQCKLTVEAIPTTTQAGKDTLVFRQHWNDPEQCLSDYYRHHPELWKHLADSIANARKGDRG